MKIQELNLYEHRESGEQYLAAFIGEMKHRDICKLIEACDGDVYATPRNAGGRTLKLLGMVNTRYSGIVMLTTDSVVLFEPSYGYPGELEALEVVSRETFPEFYKEAEEQERPRIAGRQINHLLGTEVLSGEELSALLSAMQKNGRAR